MSTKNLKLVLVRHGESTWNKLNKFTGWTDVGLTEKGLKEAQTAGKLLKEGNYKFTVVYTSLLKRAIKTMWTILEETDQMWLPVHRSWRLNERHYGALQGLNKAETAKKHGEKQVKIWRRSYATPPPLVEDDDERYPANDPKYSKIDKKLLPKAESLKLTVDRFLPLWKEKILPQLKNKENVLIVAHGNSLRALVKYLDKISEDKIVSLNIPTGVPLVYELDEELKPVKSYYLGDEEEVKKKMHNVANQGKVKK